MLKRAFILLAALSLAAGLATYAAAQGSEGDTVRLPIVMYHHLSEKERLWGDYVLPPSQLERDLAYLKERGYTTVTAEELIAWAEGRGALPEKPVMVTFDDAYESTFVYAVPLLQKYGMKAVVSVIGSVAQQYTELPDHMLDYSHMSWEAVAEAAAGNAVEIQCHTYDMHRLTPRKGCGRIPGESEDAYTKALTADTELFQSALESYTGERASALALPYGFYSDKTIEIAAELGFKAVFTCTERVNTLTGDLGELMELCRFNRPYGMSSEVFFSKWK